MYPYPLWRRVPFIAVLIAILAISYTPATTTGTATVRISAIATPSIISHLYTGATTIQLHHQGYANNEGWTNITQLFPTVDLLTSTNQTTAQTLITATVHSGRFDTIRILFANSSMVITGTTSGQQPIIAPSPLTVNATLLVSPDGTGDLDIVVAFDYSTLFSTPPALTLVLVRASTA
jgi:hypothetical protein